MSQYTDEQKKFLNQKFTLKGRILFPNLLTLKKKSKPEDRDVYDVQFAWRPEENPTTMGQLGQWLGQASAIFHQGCNPAALVNPIKDFNTYQRQDAKANPEYLRGQLWVNASTGKDYPPQVVKSSPMGLVRLTEADDAEVYSGRNAVISISFWPMIPKPGSANQKRGFSVNVDAVLLQDGGETVGGANSVDVNAVFGSFIQDMGATPNFGNFGQAPAAQPAQPAQPQWNQQPAAPAQQPAFNPAQMPGQFNPGQQPAQPAWPPQAPAAQPAQQPAQPQWNQQQQHQQAPAFPGQFNPNFNGQY